MILDPCLPVLHHTAATLRAWAVWGRARPWWHAPVRAVSGPCSRAAALAFPLLAAPGAAGPAYAPAAPGLPWIGAPGWVQTALPFGPGGYAGGFGGGYGYAGGFGLVERSNGSGRDQGQHQAFALSEQPLNAGRVLEQHQGLVVLESGQLPGNSGLLDSIPQPVPEPATLAVVAVALAGVAVGRRRG